MFRRFSRNERGNTVMLVALSLFPILAMLGGSVDIIRATNATNELEAAVASGALAAASLSQTGDARDVVESYVRTNLKDSSIDLDSLQLNVTAESSLNARRVAVQASAQLPTLFLSIFDRPQIDLNATSTATQAIQDVEISLVLDYSISMETRDQVGNQSRIETLRDAVTAPGAFIDDMLTDETRDRTSINIIPFAGTVNIGDTLFDRYAVPAEEDEWSITCPNNEDPNNAILFQGNCWRREHNDYWSCYTAWYDNSCWVIRWDEEQITVGNVDPSREDYRPAIAAFTNSFQLNPDISSSQWRFSLGDNCLEFPNSVFDNDDEWPVGGLGQFPHFWVGRYFSSVCPDSTAEIMLNTNNVTALKNHINNANTADRTAVQTGAMVAYKVMSPNMRGLLGGDYPDRPLDYAAPDAIKVMVIMTDGQSNDQFRPVDPNQHHIYAETSLNGFNNGADQSTPIPINQTNGQNGGPQTSSISIDSTFDDTGEWARQIVYQTGSPTDSLDANTATARLRRVCQAAKDDGIVIFTIGFEISAGSDQEKNMQFCASDPSKYQLVEDIELVGAFEEIAQAISNLRIVE